jgi:hypothetical protein
MPAQTNTALVRPTAPKAKVQVRLAENVDLETIIIIVRGIGGHYGCNTCGLAGVDLALSADPVEAVEFSRLPGVQSVSVE